MKLLFMLPDQIESAQARGLPLVIPAGTIEYHGAHCAYGCDSLIVEGLLERLASQQEMVIAPGIYYGPSSYAVAGPDKKTIDVRLGAFEKHAYDILKGFLYTGWRNICVVIHHQFENETLLPMSLCFLKPAKQLTFEYLEETMGRGWWGNERNAKFYEQLDEAQSPWNWIKVIPAMGAKAQKASGYDHAGKWETSLLMALYPEAVDLRRLDASAEWFARGASQARAEIGRRMIELSLEDLATRIKTNGPQQAQPTAHATK
jgi:creatinine amidohydrolase